MSYPGKLELKLKAQTLRKRGLSIKEIQRQLKVSRSSVSLWVREIKLTQKQIKKLYFNKKKGKLKGSYIAAMNKIKTREELIKKLIREGRKEIGRLSKRDRFIAGIAMYYGEGGKTDGDVSFANSDPRLIRFMIGWFREFCDISNKKFRGNLYIHDNLNEGRAKKFWSDLTKIPCSQFTKTYVVKNNPYRLRKVKHVFGVFRIKVSNVNLHRKIMGWMKGLVGYPLKKNYKF